MRTIPSNRSRRTCVDSPKGSKVGRGVLCRSGGVLIFVVVSGTALLIWRAMHGMKLQNNVEYLLTEHVSSFSRSTSPVALVSAAIVLHQCLVPGRKEGKAVESHPAEQLAKTYLRVAPVLVLG